MHAARLAAGAKQGSYCSAVSEALAADSCAAVACKSVSSCCSTLTSSAGRAPCTRSFAQLALRNCRSDTRNS